MASREDVIFHATRNALYHTARRRKLEGLNRLANFAVITFGAGAASDLLRLLRIEGGAPFLAVGAAVVGAMQLAFDFGGRARTHEMLQRRYFEVLAEATECPEPDPATVAGWDGALHRIYGEEPPNNPVFEANAHNAATQALGRDKDYLIAVPFYARVLPFLPYDGENWPYRKDQVPMRR